MAMTTRLPTINLLPVHCAGRSAGVAQLVELQPSKLNVASSNLVSRSIWHLPDRTSAIKPM